MSAQVYDQLVTKQAELSGLVAKLASEGRNATDEEKAQLDGLKADIEGIQKSWQESGRKAFLAGLERQEPRAGMVLKSTDSFADIFKGDPEEENLSIGRYVRGLVTGNWRGADLERKTAMSSAAGSGGYLIPEPLAARVIDLARNRTFAIQAGVGTVPMTSSTLTMAKQITDPTVDWYAENATISETDVTFDRLLFTAKKMAAIVRVSNELLEDAQNIDGLISESLGAAIAQELDRVILFGDGISGPLGISNTAGINTVTSVGTPNSYDKFLDAIYAVRGYNFEPNAAMYSSRTAQTLAKMVTGLTSDKTKLVPPADFTNLSRYVTQQIPNTLGGGGAESVAIVGQWNQYLLALRSDVRLEISRDADTAFLKDQTLIRVVWRGDGLLVQPRAFAYMSGITA